MRVGNSLIQMKRHTWNVTSILEFWRLGVRGPGINIHGVVSDLIDIPQTSISTPYHLSSDLECWYSLTRYRTRGAEMSSYHVLAD